MLGDVGEESFSLFCDAHILLFDGDFYRIAKCLKLFRSKFFWASRLGFYEIKKDIRLRGL